MATSSPTEMQVESEISVQEAVKELVEIEVEEDEGDPFEGMNNAQIAEIYHQMKPEDRRLFRQFKKFHKLYFNLHGHDVPSHHLARDIISEIFSSLPANARAELLVAERLKDLFKQLGLAFPVYRDKGTPPKKGGGSSFTVTKLLSSLEPKGQRPLSLPHSP